VIPQRAIKRYLNEPRDDHNWLKKLTHKELDRLLSELPHPPRPHPKLGLHQKAGLYLGIRFGSFAFFYDMGTGKTLLSLELLQYFWDAGLLRRALVFVVSDKAFSTWERQVRQYKITVPFCTLDASSSVEKWHILDHFDEGIVFLHYPGTVAMVTERAVPKKGKRKKGGKKMALAPDKVERLLLDVDAAIFDESTKAGNTNSLTYKLCLKASKQAEFRFALAGMPFGRDPTPLWPQMNLVDHGETLGKTLGLFRAAFFNEEENRYGGPYSKIYNFKKQLKPKLSRMVQHNSLCYTADECIDLPPDRRIVETIKLPADTKAYYQEIVNELISAKGNLRAIKNAFHRMRQLSSGFLGLKDDETGERAEIEFAENPKLDLCLDLLDSVPEGHKALVFYQYTVSGRRIAKAIKEELGCKPIWLWSGTKNPREELRRFIEDDDVPFAVINNQVGAYSLDGLQVANYELFFESPVGVIDRTQAERRVLRQGQKFSKVFLYDLIVEGTVDEKILAFHKEGLDLFKALLANPASMLR
jgi:hypothetical protein